GEPWPIEELPIAAGAEDRRVLQRVRLPGLVLAEINLFVVGLVFVDTKIESNEAPLGWRRDVHIDHAIAHLKAFQDRGCSIHPQSFSSLIVDDLRVSVEFPAWRIRRDR